MSEEVKLDWSSAEVKDGTLVIGLEGKLEKGWKKAFERTNRLLNGGAWEEVTLKKRKISVRPLAPGDEDRVRHFLEGVVLQANSAVDTGDQDRDQTDETDGAKEKDAEGSPEDQEMTERLRSFGQGTD